MIYVKYTKMGRPVAKPLSIKSVKNVDWGYGPGKLRPDGSRQPQVEHKLLSDIAMDINGMSAHSSS